MPKCWKQWGAKLPSGRRHHVRSHVFVASPGCFGSQEAAPSTWTHHPIQGIQGSRYAESPRDPLGAPPSCSPHSSCSSPGAMEGHQAAHHHRITEKRQAHDTIIIGHYEINYQHRYEPLWNHKVLINQLLNIPGEYSKNYHMNHSNFFKPQ